MVLLECLENVVHEVILVLQASLVHVEALEQPELLEFPADLVFQANGVALVLLDVQ